MKRTVSESDFIEAFKEMNREENFSYYGIKVLFDYLEELEEATGQEMELDVIAICCDFSEYTEEELVSEYGYKLEREEDQDDEEYLAALIEELQDYTNVLKVVVDNQFMDNNGQITYIIQAF